MTDTPVVLDADGYPLRYGKVYRFVAIVPESAMSALNLGGPTQRDLRAAAIRLGWSPEATRFYWPDQPALDGWPPIKQMDDYVIRGEGTWAGKSKLPVQTPLEEFGTWMGWINVWEHTDKPVAAPPNAAVPPSDAAPRSRPSSRTTPDALAPSGRKRKKKASPFVPWIVLGGLVGGAWLVWKLNQRPPTTEAREETTDGSG